MMLETKFIRCIVNDILSSGEYNPFGIALYTDVPVDGIYDMASGFNVNPTFQLTRKSSNCIERSNWPLSRNINKITKLYVSA